MSEYQQRMEGVEIAFNQLEPIIRDQAQQIEMLTNEPKVKQNKVTSKTVQVEPQLAINYKFEDVFMEANAQLNYENFSFDIFKGMHEEILQVEKPYHDVKSMEGVYSKEYINKARDEALLNVLDVKQKYQDKYREELKRLRQPKIDVPYMTSDEKTQNLLMRLNNSIIASELMRTLSVEELDNLYEQNKGNAEVRMLIKARAFHLFRVLKDKQLREKALHLKGKIQAYDNELMNPEHLKNLDMIEYNLDYIWGNSDRYVENLHEMQGDFKGIKFRKFFS